MTFLLAQRWFGAKAARPAAARIDTAIPLEWDDGAFVIARVTVSTDGEHAQYQVPLAARGVSAGAVPKEAMVASVTVSGSPIVVYDAVQDPVFQRCLADATSAGAMARGANGAEWIYEALTPARIPIAKTATLRVASGEQSNTSIVFDREAILKLYRRLEPGIHPDVELSELLTRRAGFVNTPATIAVLRLRDADGGEMVSGMVQELVPDAKDAWSYFLEQGRRYFTAKGDDKERRPTATSRGDDKGRPPGATDPSLGDASRIGEITRALHDALASDAGDRDFAPEAATQTDAERWAVQTKEQIRAALDLLGKGDARVASEKSSADRLQLGSMPEAKALVGRRERYLQHVDELAAGLDADLGARTRVHGDYHLGQLLRSASGDFMVIDFEGEPGRPLAERRAKKSPLRDVAGMLRSFAYAAAALSKSVAREVDPAARELRAGRWERDVRAAFLDGYLSSTGSGRHHLPTDPEHSRRLIALFETEKVFFELAYELNHRPDWAWIPMRGIAKLLV